jgi:hypothetical protein
LRCPFGCSQAHRKEESKRRSLEYYQSPEGRKKKRELNARRSEKKGSEDCPEVSSSGDEKSNQQESEILLDKVTVVYIKGVTSLIEGREVGIDEILVILNNRMRQRSIDKQKRFIYAINYPRGQTER